MNRDSNFFVFSSLFLILLFNLFLYCQGSQKFLKEDISVKQATNSRTNVICKSFNKMQQRAACNRAFRQLSSQLEKDEISIDNATVALQYRNGTDFKVQGWCGSSTFLLNQNIGVIVNGDYNIPLSANVLTDTYRINMIIPAKVSGRFRARHRLGRPSLSGCRFFYNDYFTMFGSSYTTIRVKGEFGVRTSYKETAKNYIVRLRPIVSLDFSIMGDLDMRWKFSGLSRIVAFLVRNVRTVASRLLRRTMKIAMNEDDDRIKLRLQASIEEKYRKAFATNGDGVRIITVPKV